MSELVSYPVYQEVGSKHCVFACMASVLGLSIEDIIKEAKKLGIDTEVGCTLQDEYFLFHRLGYINNIIVYDVLSTKLCPDKLYLVTVPSLTVYGGGHRIIVQTTKDMSEDVPYKIHDPQPTGNRYGVTHKLIAFFEIVEFIDSYLQLE